MDEISSANVVDYLSELYYDLLQNARKEIDAYTVVGRATGTSQIVGIAVVETTSVNSTLTVRNPAGNAAALTVTPLAGGTRPVSAHLTIIQLQ